MIVVLLCLFCPHPPAANPAAPSPFAATGLLARQDETAGEILLRAHQRDAKAILLVVVGYMRGLGGFPKEPLLAVTWMHQLRGLGAPDVFSLPGLMFLEETEPERMPPLGTQLAFCDLARRDKELVAAFKEAALFDLEQVCEALEAAKGATPDWEDAYTRARAAISEKEYVLPTARVARELCLRPATAEDEQAVDRLSDTPLALFLTVTTHDPAKGKPDWSNERLIAFLDAQYGSRQDVMRFSAIWAMGREAILSLPGRLSEDPADALADIRRAHDGDMEAVLAMARYYQEGTYGFPKSVWLANAWLAYAAHRGDGRCQFQAAAASLYLGFPEIAQPWAEAARSSPDEQVRAEADKMAVMLDGWLDERKKQWAEGTREQIRKDTQKRADWEKERDARPAAVSPGQAPPAADRPIAQPEESPPADALPTAQPEKAPRTDARPTAAQPEKTRAAEISPFAATGLLVRPDESAGEILLRAHQFDVKAMALAVAGYSRGLGGFPKEPLLASEWAHAVERLGALEAGLFVRFLYRTDRNADSTDQTSRHLLSQYCPSIRESALAARFQQAGLFDPEQFCDPDGGRTYWTFGSLLESDRKEAGQAREAMLLIRELRSRPVTRRDMERLDELSLNYPLWVFFAATAHDPATEHPDWSAERLLDFLNAQKSHMPILFRSGDDEVTEIGVYMETPLRFIVRTIMKRQAEPPARALDIIARAHKGDMEAINTMIRYYREGSFGFAASGLEEAWMRYAAFRGDGLNQLMLALHELESGRLAKAWAWAELARLGGDGEPHRLAAILAKRLEARPESYDPKAARSYFEEYRMGIEWRKLW